MTLKECKRERDYQMSMHLVWQMLKKGIISEADSRALGKQMNKKFNPILGTLLSRNNLINV